MKLKNKLRLGFNLGFMLSLVFLMTACPYSSEVPIDKPSVKVPSDIIGTWVSSSYADKDKPSTYYVISKKDANVFRVKEYSYKKEDDKYEDKKMYDGHLSNLKNKQFLNLYDIGNTKYYFYRLNDLNSSKMELQEVSDNITEKFSTSAELKSFFTKYMDLSFFFNKSESKYVKRDDIK